MRLVKFTRQFLFLTALLGCLLLSACACQSCPPARSPNLGKPCGPLMDALEAEGVQVIARGDILRLILPADVFFGEDGKFKPQKDVVLNEIAELLVCGCYGTMSIRVFGYSDDVGSIPEQMHRSYEQAHDVAAFLWSAGIPLSRMVVRGLGAQQTIAINETPRGSAYNRRVEILVP